MNFYTLFPKAEDVHLFKEIGLTPYYMYKECGYTSTLVSYNNGDYSNLKELNGLNHEFLDNKYYFTLFNVISYLRKNSKDIDVLLCFHYTSCIYFLFYKLFNPRGITYLKMDTDSIGAAKYSGHENGFINCIIYFMILFVFYTVIDFASVESRKGHSFFMDSNNIFKEKVIYVPIYMPESNLSSQKKNQLISVGRIGSHQKASDVVLKSFKKAVESNICENWVLKIVGPISDDFNDYIDNFFKDSPELKNRIVFTGEIHNKTELYNLYSESKIFILPSRHESSGIVFVEGAYFEDYLIITPVGLAEQLLSLTNFGKLVEIDNVDEISGAIVDAILNWDKYFEENKIDIKKAVGDEYSPITYSHIIDDKIKSILEIR